VIEYMRFLRSELNVVYNCMVVGREKGGRGVLFVLGEGGGGGWRNITLVYRLKIPPTPNY